MRFRGNKNGEGRNSACACLGGDGHKIGMDSEDVWN